MGDSLDLRIGQFAYAHVTDMNYENNSSNNSDGGYLSGLVSNIYQFAGKKSDRKGKPFDAKRGVYVGTEKRDYGADSNRGARNWSDIQDPIERARAIMDATRSNNGSKPSRKDIERARELLRNRKK